VRLPGSQTAPEDEVDSAATAADADTGSQPAVV